MAQANLQHGPSQSRRMARLETPYGPDKIVLTRFDGDEGISELFEYRIDALSQDENIDFDKLIGRHCSVAIDTYDEGQRFFNGLLVEAQWVGVQDARFAYRLVLRPWLWLLGRRADCRIFKDKNVLDIIEDVFNEGGFGDFEIRASRSEYKIIEYCVQYRETDLAFVSRLMEEWGIYTFFEHERSKHKLVLADSRSCHAPAAIPGGTVPFIPLVERDRRPCEHLHHWLAERRFRTGKVSANDFDYMKPTADLKAESKAGERYERSNEEVYDYPGRYLEQGDGRRLTKVRLEAEQAADGRKLGAGDAVSLFPGSLATLAQHPTDDGQYLVLRATHAYAAEQYRTGEGAGGSGEMYRGHYEFLKSDRPFRAPIVTPRPLVHGPQTALVVTRKGKEGEEIDVDEEGRIFVQFHWNRNKERISKPVRVAQMWSGKTWGWQIIPRVGQEVVVEFLEGDPDQPLVVGAVYNKDYPFPYSLPDNKTISGVKSDSTKGHGGYNEFVFEDKKSEENIMMRAEKDHEVVIRHAETRVIGETFETPCGEPSRSTTLKSGDEKMKVETGDWDVDVAQKVHIKAGVELVLEVGASKITIDPASITIKAGEVTLNGTALITQQAPLIKIN